MECTPCSAIAPVPLTPAFPHQHGSQETAAKLFLPPERLWTRPAALPGKPISPHTLYHAGILHYTSLCSLGEEEDEGCEPQEPGDCKVRKHHLDSDLIS